ncbi:hypothetical protein B0T24DRAFT_629303 [Lasiosphaeria ovina]|uniref:Uncharacterized protein n=1 Tax=Lasiosphaeria ovina TaxID=92902 RepID=A0AAE0N5G9_9PEZI|nr:hypothetical protein B0T24DRAFT_629303 [Lasiosphaeria ovina]
METGHLSRTSAFASSICATDTASDLAIIITFTYQHILVTIIPISHIPKHLRQHHSSPSYPHHHTITVTIIMCRETVTEVTVQMAATNLADDGEANPFGALMPPHGAPAQDPNFIMPLPWEGADGTHVPVPSPTLSASRSPSSTPVASSSASAWAAGHDHAPPASPAAAHGSFVVFGIDSGAKIDFDADMDALIRRGRVRPGTRHVRRGPVVAAATATATATAPAPAAE